MNNTQKQNETLKDGFKRELRQRTMGYILTAFGLITGLAWNDAIKTSIEYLFPLQKNNLLVKFIYAIIMTVILVFISIYLMRLAKQEKAEK